MLDPQQRGLQVREAEAMATISIVAPVPIRSPKANDLMTPVPVSRIEEKRPEMVDRMRRMPAETAEMMAITKVATTKHLFPLRAPPMARPPEMKKKTEVQIPVATDKLSTTKFVISIPREIKPKIMWMMPSTVAALTLYASLMFTFSLAAWTM